MRDLGLLEARFCLCHGSADQPPCENSVDGSDHLASAVDLRRVRPVRPA